MVNKDEYIIVVASATAVILTAMMMITVTMSGLDWVPPSLLSNWQCMY